MVDVTIEVVEQVFEIDLVGPGAGLAAQYAAATDAARIASEAARAGAETAAAAAGAAAAAAVRGRVEMLPPLKPAQTATNALKNRYSDEGETIPPAALTVSTLDAAAYAFAASVFSETGEPGVLRLSNTASAANALRPEQRFSISVADLATIGVVPDNTTPPQISMKGGIRIDTKVNQTISLIDNVEGQVWFGLRYDGAGASMGGSISASKDVIFVNDRDGPLAGFLGAGDALWTGNVGDLTASAGLYKKFRRLGIKVPATYGGKALSGAFFIVYGRKTASGASSLDAFDLAVVAGATIDWNTLYTNPDDVLDTTVRKPQIDALELTVTQKVDYVPPLKPDAFVNAIRHRYGATSVNRAAISGAITGSPLNVWDEDLYDLYGEPSLIQVPSTSVVINDYKPEADIIVSPADLLRIGVVPDDTTPPTISIRAAIALAGLVNQNIDTTANSGFGQVWIGLRYDGAAGSDASAFAAARQDIVLSNNNTGVVGAYYTPAVNLWAASVGQLLSDTAHVKGYKRQGIPVPATVNGKALTHIKIKI